MTEQSEQMESPPLETAISNKTTAPTELTNRQVLLDQIGQKLTQARQQREESIDDVVLKLKYQKAQLQALESGNWEGLPDEVYALGFLRQYATHLRLDLADEIYRLRNNQYALTKPRTFPDPPVAPSRKWAWIFGAGFIVLFVIFNVINHADQQPAPPPVLQPAASDSQPPAILIMDQAAPPIQPESDVSSDVIKNKKTAGLELAPEIKDIQSPPTSQTTHHFSFKAATDAVWLQVYLPDETGREKGRLYKEVLLKKGRQMDVEENVKLLWITCGRPLSLEISIDGNIQYEAGSFGVLGKVMRNFQLKLAQ